MMSFITDKQTLDDLNILGKYKSNSIFKLFNEVQTAGGAKLLDQMFLHPLMHEEAINSRTAIFKYCQNKQLDFPFDVQQITEVENYLSMATSGGQLSAFSQFGKKVVSKYMGLDKEYNLVKTGLYKATQLINQLHGFLENLSKIDSNSPFNDKIDYIRDLCQQPRLNWLINASADELSILKLMQYDYLIRHVFLKELKELLQILYELDVFIAVSGLAGRKGFSYAKALPKSETTIKMTNVRHPGLKNGVANSVTIHHDQNVVFLTGANMAGKSTFMKSFGVAIYLAHMGFPVAVEEMEFSVQDGIYTSINVPDNLNMGYSHFYAEVLRVKKVAEAVASSKNLVVIFDELFKGTNVKDAYDATVAVTAGFSAHRNCSYIISTHIIEVAEELNNLSNFQFVYLPTIMDGNIPKYTYRLKRGVTADRHGMMIIDNERILEIIKG